MSKVILSILGHDRPGIVAAFSNVLFEHECNNENVSQTTLQFEFAGIIADEMAIGVINNKTTAARLIPVPEKNAGDSAYFGGLLGQSTIISVNNGHNPNYFVRRGGLIPAPIQSLTN
jgi:uncharacterized protein (UPF0210 family)